MHNRHYPPKPLGPPGVEGSDAGSQAGCGSWLVRSVVSRVWSWSRSAGARWASSSPCTASACRWNLDDADELLAEHTDPTGFYTAMRGRHPDHLNPSTLWGSALALYAGRH